MPFLIFVDTCVDTCNVYLKRLCHCQQTFTETTNGPVWFFVTDLYTTSDSTTLDDDSNETDIKQAKEIGEMTRRLQEETVRERMVHGWA